MSRAGSVTALETAALSAEAEAAALLAEARHALTLEGTSRLLYDVATDAIEAYDRAAGRALQARKLADHCAGEFNAFARREAGQ